MSCSNCIATETTSASSDLLRVLRKLKLEPFRSGKFLNSDYDMARLSITLPLVEAKRLLAELDS